MSEKLKLSSPKGEIAGSTHVVARRRFVRGVGVVVPTVLTIGSQSAMATAGRCLSPSASASINLTHSRNDRARAACAGLGPNSWVAEANAYPQPTGSATWVSARASGIYFKDVYAGGHDNLTLKEVMALNASSPNHFGAHLAAAWCNLQSGKVPSDTLSAEMLIAMWAGWKNSGKYYPIPGNSVAFWTSAETVSYLQATMVS